MVTSSIWHTYCRISFKVGAWRYTTEIMLASIIINVTCVWTTARICQQPLIIIYETVALSNENELSHMDDSLVELFL